MERTYLLAATAPASTWYALALLVLSACGEKTRDHAQSHPHEAGTGAPLADATAVLDSGTFPEDAGAAF